MRELLGQRAEAVLELRKMLGRGLADLVLQRDDRVADQVGQALGSARQHLHRRASVAQRHADRLEGVVGPQRFDGLLAVDGDLACPRPSA